MAKDRWPELCKTVESDDDLPVRDVGSWTEDKLWFWHRYVEITTAAMAKHQKWNGMVYVDMFAGPGVCKIRSSERRIPGSTIVAAQASKPFTKIIAVELDSENANALRMRLQTIAPDASVIVYQEDCNTVIDKIVNDLPAGALTLAFFDPEGLDFEFTTVETLVKGRAVDLLVLFADAYDIVRNVDLYVSQESSKLDRLLGTKEWRDEWGKINNRKSVVICDFFATQFESQLRDQLGYKEFRRKRINGPKGALYTLIFASKHQKGGEFWDKISKRDSGGQMEIPFNGDPL